MSVNSYRGRKAALLSLLSAVALVGCSSAGGQTHPVAATTTKPSATATGAKSPATPLSAVGPGWSLAQYSASTSGGVTPRKTGPTTLYLVGPNGYRDALYNWPAGQDNWTLIGWSGDKTRALFTGPDGTAGQLVLATGKFTSFKLPGGTQPIGYTRPDGTAILAAQQVMSTGKIVRYDLNGRQEQVLASGPSDAPSTAVDAPDGTTLAVNGTKALELVSNTGKAVRSLPVPGRPTCQPVRWWDPGTILASCVAPGTAASRLWLVPASGATPTALTPQRGSGGPDLGDLNAWRLPDSLYLQAAGACGVVFIAKPASTGAATPVNVPGTTGNDNLIVTALGPKLLVRAQTSCESSTSLLWFTPTTNATQMLMKAPRNIQGVIADIPYTPAS